MSNADSTRDRWNLRAPPEDLCEEDERIFSQFIESAHRTKAVTKDSSDRIVVSPESGETTGKRVAKISG